MEHPRMFDEDDRLLARVRALCATLPGSAEKEAWGRPTFRAAPKIYAVYGSHEGHSTALIIKPDPDEAPALREDPRFFSPKYYGPSGWLAIDLDDATDWDEVAELLASSFRQVAPARLVAELDAHGLAHARPDDPPAPGAPGTTPGAAP